MADTTKPADLTPEQRARVLLHTIAHLDKLMISAASISAIATAIREAIESDRAGRAQEARPLEEWHEDMGDVLWWKFPVTEAPYVGSPTCLGQTVEIHDYKGVVARGQVGGWPGYHTHFTPLPPAPSTSTSTSAGEA